MSITEIALDCGFSSSAAFARAFKEAFHMSASQWRSGGYLEESNIRKTKGKEGQMLRNSGKDVEIILHYADDAMIKQIWRMKMTNKNEVQVEVRDMPEHHVVYVRHIGPYQGDGSLFANLFERLFKWAGPRGLLRFPETQVMAVYHDDPDITAEENLRTSVCITVPQGTEVDGEIGKMTVPGGKFAVARFEIFEDQYQEAWDAIYGAWLPESGYQPDDRLCYELFHNDPNQHPERKHIFDICVPVKPL
jgi:AraC family transcriptional regulator